MRGEIMTDSTDYRLYLEEKFEGITKLVNAQFNTVHDKLESIEIQTMKTNGRVTVLEKQVDTVEKDLLIHPINCNKAKTIEDIEKNVKELHDESVGRGAVKKTDKQRYFSVLKTIGIIFVVLTFAFGIFRNNKKTDTIITNEAANKEMNDSIRKVEIQKIKAEARGVLIPINSKPFVLDTVRVDSIINSYLKR
jgi:hypothetical protein